MSYNGGHQIGNACWQLCETFYGRDVCILLDWKLFLPIVIVAIVQHDLARLFSLVSLGVTHYSWGLVGIDFDTELNKSSEF